MLGDGVFPVFGNSADVTTPRIATADIGAAGADALLEAPAESEVVDLDGPVSTEREVAAVLSGLLARELRVVTISAERLDRRDGRRGIDGAARARDRRAVRRGRARPAAAARRPHPSVRRAARNDAAARARSGAAGRPLVVTVVVMTGGSSGFGANAAPGIAADIAAGREGRLLIEARSVASAGWSLRPWLGMTSSVSGSGATVPDSSAWRVDR